MYDRFELYLHKMSISKKYTKKIFAFIMYQLTFVGFCTAFVLLLMGIQKVFDFVPPGAIS